jgi:hypothetical protein
MAQLLLLVVPPGFVWVSSLVAILIGLALFLLTALEGSGWDSARKWYSVRAFVSKIRWRDIVKDVGIGFLVAGVVSLTYEWATRSTAERAEGLEIINKVMSGIIGPNVWQEISDETIKMPRVRRNLTIEMRLQRDWKLHGRAVVLPKCRAVLYMKLSYDLYRVSSQEPQTPIQQAVDYEMWDEELRLPRFESVTVITQVNPLRVETVEYRGEKLKEISTDEKGFKLEGEHEVKFPEEARLFVRIVTERYELVDIPGNYNLTMGALTARVPENIGEHTITLTINRLDDVEPEITTNWGGHVFTHNADKSVWTFDGIMLPGQGLQVTFKVPRDKKGRALRPCE